MPDTGWLITGSGENIGVGQLWMNPERITALDSSDATVATAPGTTAWLTATFFGVSLPSGKVPELIEVKINHGPSTCSLSGEAQAPIYLTKDGGFSRGSQPVGAIQSGATGNVIYSNPLAPLGGLTLTEAEVESDLNFGVQVQGTATGGDDLTLRADAIYVKVHYAADPVLDEPSVLRIGGSGARW